MKKKIVLAALVVVVVAVFAGAYALYGRLSEDYSPDNLSVSDTETTDSQNPTETAEPEARTYQAPDFTVIDYSGAEVNLSVYFGKPIVLNFWASWCPPCKEEMPDFNAAAQEHTDIQFLMVNMTDGDRETVEIAKEYVEAQGFNFPVFFDTELSAATAYGAYSLPTTYFIDGDGNLTTYANGMIDANTLERGIQMIK
mgnify:FL=1